MTDEENVVCIIHNCFLFFSTEERNGESLSDNENCWFFFSSYIKNCDNYHCHCCDNRQFLRTSHYHAILDTQLSVSLFVCQMLFSKLFSFTQGNTSGDSRIILAAQLSFKMMEECLTLITTRLCHFCFTMKYTTLSSHAMHLTRLTRY